MVNKNSSQWDETMQDEQESSYEYDDDYIDSENSQDEYELDENEGNNSTSGTKTQLVVILLLIIVLVIAGALIVYKLATGLSNKDKGMVQNNIEEVKDKDVSNSFFDEASNNEQEEMASVDFDNTQEEENKTSTETGLTEQGAIAQEERNQTNETNNTEQGAIAQEDLFGQQNNTSTVGVDSKTNGQTEQKKDSETNENDSIVVAWNKASKQNPFRPPVITDSKELESKNLKDNKLDNVPFEIIEPPTDMIEADKNIEKILKTQISGILYDEESPSAIVNFSGRDEFVKIGEEVLGCTIKNITKTKVEISYKNNTFTASVGELFVPGKLESLNAVSNLSNKFGGRYKNENERVEE